MKPARVWMAGAVLVALGAWILTNARGHAADDKENVNPETRKIADALKEGKTADADKLAAVLAKKDLEVVMKGYKLRSGGGLGVGAASDNIKPDGIEALLINSRRVRPALLMKYSEAFAQMGYDSAAITLVALKNAPEKNEGKKTRAAWNGSAGDLLKASMDLAKAAKAKDGAAAKAALGKMSASCTKCHNIFREK